jgi:hypothetical protein
MGDAVAVVTAPNDTAHCPKHSHQTHVSYGNGIYIPSTHFGDQATGWSYSLITSHSANFFCTLFHDFNDFNDLNQAVVCNVSLPYLLFLSACAIRRALHDASWFAWGFSYRRSRYHQTQGHWFVDFSPSSLLSCSPLWFSRRSQSQSGHNNNIVHRARPRVAIRVSNKSLYPLVRYLNHALLA